MREKLAKRNNERNFFTGTFSKFGTKTGYRHQEPTVLLTNIKDEEGNNITDHLWFNYTKLFEQLWEEENLYSGDIIAFSARVKPYSKGYEKDEIDFKLSRPTKLKIIKKNPEWMKEKNCELPYKYIKNFVFYSHLYYKFNSPEYTSIRSLNSLEYYELNQKIDAKLEEEILHSAIIFKIEKRKISSLSLDFLKKDCEYSGFEIKSKSEFIDLINSLRNNKKNHVKLENDPEFAVYYFHKIIENKPKKKFVWTDTIHKGPSLDRYLKGVKK